MKESKSTDERESSDDPATAATCLVKPAFLDDPKTLEELAKLILNEDEPQLSDQPSE